MNISFQNISLEFNNRKIFEDFSLEIKSGEKIIIHGESGTGKSSLVKMLLGFVPFHNGKILVDDQDLDDDLIWNLRSKIAYIPQEPDIPECTCRAFLDDILEFHTNKAIKYDNLEKYRADFQLPEKFWESNTQEISGGEKSRLAIIISLILGRKVFILDEATAALDSLMKQKVVDLFTTNPDWTVISVSHDELWLNSDLTRKVEIKSLLNRES